MKKLLAILMAVVFVVCTFAACGGKDTTDDSAATDLKIGVIVLHDESIGYDAAHINGVKEAAKALNISEDQIIWKKSIPEDASCADAARDLAGQGCDVIISDSYGHQTYMQEVAGEFTDITFISMTGDTAASSGKELCAFHRYYNRAWVFQAQRLPCGKNSQTRAILRSAPSAPVDAIRTFLTQQAFRCTPDVYG